MADELDIIEDGFGNVWGRCGEGCELEVVRVGKVHMSDKLRDRPTTATPKNPRPDLLQAVSALQWARPHLSAAQYRELRACVAKRHRRSARWVQERVDHGWY